MKLAFLDSSAFLALEDPSEKNHDSTLQAMNELVGDGFGLLTTNFVFDEAYTLILSRLGRQRAVHWGTALKESQLVQVAAVNEDHEAAAWQIILSHTDKDYSYTDATSFAVATRLGITEALAVDRHFNQFGAFNIRPA